ncbi:KN motif and ankyrin repeat domain-containing protein 4 [Rhinatrema bivittatum]|uniref:KN motif and ankyrin repeat domain-containing protein 4 n=1 Tax=Rhinatrema bivittatum TaxID=194408 RepID=UPI00112C24FC|nr:KN motif and ankyrin repeat domain-containing protein 4 [Rhinatrema bivittatum]XP_029473714.1 KN motif and ankyrin repeat domain-containing protein 4 [Rhinatrema bivittatum]XP_029473715.1 KN motif and ankyrin repeat domain-containing protein 4 [Rhinatrema bivittatum]XP_029473717.1 KN motif and ankyrin repeat domain-containing protein 4 [Rhinatrema bivittatum]
MEKINKNNQASKSGENKKEHLPYSVETPYGFYLDLDFLKYVDDIEKGNTIKKVHVHRKTKQSKFSTLPRNFSVPDSGPRSQASSTSTSRVSTTCSTAPRKEVIDMKEMVHLIPNSDPAQSLRKGYELKYRDETNRQAEQIYPGEQLSSPRNRPQLLRASSMPASLLQHKSSEEPNQFSMFSQSSLRPQQRILTESIFTPLDGSLSPHCFTGLELTHPGEKSKEQQQVQEALKRIKELEEQVKTIPELNQKISLLSEEKIQLTLQLQNQQSRALESDDSDVNCDIKGAMKALPLLSVSTQTFIPDNEISEEIELSIIENEPLTHIKAESKSTGDGVAEEKTSFDPSLYTSSEPPIYTTLKHQITTLENNLRTRTDELEKLKAVVEEQEKEISIKDMSLQELATAKDLSHQAFESLKFQLEEVTKEIKIPHETDGWHYEDIAVNTEPMQEDEHKETSDKSINVNICHETQSIGCGDYDINITEPELGIYKGTKAHIDHDNLVDVDSTGREDQPKHVTAINQEGAGSCIKSDVNSCLSESFAFTVLKIDEPLYDCLNQTGSNDEQPIASASAGERCSEEGESKTHENEDTVFKKEEVAEQQSSPADTPVGQYVKKIQELLQEQWTCLEQGHPELAKVIKQPASKLSSIQNQLVSSLNLLSSVYSSETVIDKENSKTNHQQMVTSPSTSLKSIMKRKDYRFHAGGNGMKKNLQFVGVNGGYETTSSEDTSCGDSLSEGSADSDVEGKCEASGQAKNVSRQLEVAYETTQYTENKDQEEQELEDTTIDSSHHRPERCTFPEGFLKHCQFLSRHLSEISTTTNEQQRQALNAVCQEWFRASSRTSSSSDTVAVYLEELGSMNAQLLEMIVNMADANGNTALHYSISHSNFSIVKLLLDTGVCDVDHENQAGYTAVMLTSLASAETEEEMEIVLKLLKQGNVDIRASQGGQTALMLAVSHGRADMVRILLSRGADVNLQDDEGRSALMAACEGANVEIVNLLLARPECNTALTDKIGNSALSLVLGSAHGHIADLLQAHTEHCTAPSP